MKDGRYIVISPVRNEDKFLQLTIDSMAKQTLLPAQWIIVDDGSTDNTAKIAKAAAEKYDWITVVVREDRGFRKPGGGVIEAFYDGFKQIKNPDWQFVVKFDGDLSYGPDYFEQCLHRFEKDKKLGIGGGTICNQRESGLVVEAPGDPKFHVRGASKIYKRECWDAIGGLLQAPGWDTVDEYKANMLGWSTYTFPGLDLCHHRPAGGAQGTWKNWKKNGLANYIAGYHPLFMVVKCASRVFSKPYGVTAAGLWLGFVSGYLNRVPQTGDADVIRYLRGQQLRKLFMRKSLWDVRPL